MNAIACEKPPLNLKTFATLKCHRQCDLTEQHSPDADTRRSDALEGVMESWERSFDAAGQGAVALNRKIIDIAQRNINSSFDLAKNLAGAKNLAEAVEMQSSYWRNQLDTLAAQAEEVRTLSTQVAANAAKPMERGMEELKKAR